MTGGFVNLDDEEANPEETDLLVEETLQNMQKDGMIRN